jgi:hypothetical protein
MRRSYGAELRGIFATPDFEALTSASLLALPPAPVLDVYSYITLACREHWRPMLGLALALSKEIADRHLTIVGSIY